MNYAIIHLAAQRARSSIRSVESSGGWWVQFGSDVLVYSAAGKWRGVVGGLGAAAHGAETPQGDVRKGDMHLVVQKGRTFQMEHPEARVILDKGRFLVVEMPKAEARRLAGRREPCFHIEPLRENTVVFEERPRRDRVARAPDPRVAAVVGGLQRPGFEAALAHLVSLRTRLSTSQEYTAAAEWARGVLESLGLTVTVAPVSVGSGQSSNVIATKTGTGGPERGVLLVVGHLDSINQPGGPAADAPGADDNASGSAGVLALANALASHQFTHDLKFILFGGEEQGLLGSTQYLAGLSQAERGRLRGVLNMDMIGSINAQPPAVLLEGAALSQPMIDGLAEAAAQFTALTVQTSLNPFASDHVPFIQAGIPAVLTIEGADGANDAIHTANDTLDRIDAGFAMQILAMNAGFLAAEAGLVVQPQNQPADCGCGCSGKAKADPALAQAVHQIAAHYQALFAQYARLQRDGAMQPNEIASWQAARAAYEALIAGTGAAPPSHDS